MSSRLALEAPAQYCAGEGEETDFCQVIKEYAAAVRSISGALYSLHKQVKLEPASFSKSAGFRV